MGISTDDKRKEAILHEIIENVRLQREILPYEISAQDFAEQAGISITTARRKLIHLVEEGKMRQREISTDQGRLVVYSVI